MLKEILAARGFSASLIMVGVFALSACSSSNDSRVVGPTPPPSISPTPTGTTSPTPTVTATPTPTPTPTDMATPTPTVTATPTVTPTVTPTPTGTPVVYGVRAGNELVRFAPDAPGTVESLGSFGIDMADPIVGLDRRPADDALYAISRSGRIFVLEVVEPAMEGDDPTFTETELQSVEGDGALLGDGRIAADFNPAANALRLIDDAGLNLRVPSPALTDPAPATPVDTLVDGRMGYRQGVTAAAYTNPHPGTVATPATELFVIDSENDALYQQNANAGELTHIADLSIAIEDVNGYDVFQAAADAANEHYVVTVNGDDLQLFGLNPADGVMTLLSSRSDVPEATGLVVIENDNPIGGPPLRALVLDGSGSADVIRSFSFNRTPVDLTGTPLTTLTIEGLDTGERLLGIDSRTTSQVSGREDVVYGVTTEGRVVALLEETQDVLTVTDAVTLSVDLDGVDFAVDFNPAVDLLRVLGDSGQNLRVNLQTGRMIEGEQRAAGFAFVDRTTRITSPDDTDGGLPPQIVATAYRAAPGDGFQFAIDADNSSLVRVVVPNDGALEVVGPLGGGLTLPANDAGAADQSLDISGPADMALASLLPVGATRSALYAIDLETGTATLIGSIGATDSDPVSAITVRFE